MTLAAKTLLTFILLISFCFIHVVCSLSLNSEKDTKNILKLINLPGLSLSIPHLDNRILQYKDERNSIYLGLTKDTYSSFVYAK